ncbi:MAG: lysophospholipid acyltransferase family protein [Candidatus Marinimicrobia bacterium]|nr:lysophospholipid acyltransferase family protein [Candidatus Neomarinimicrobiota bacterium]
MILSHKITYIFLKTLSFCLRIFPLWISNLLSNFLYIILFYLVPIRKKQAFKNLNLAFPYKSSTWYFKTTKDSYKFFISNFIQFFAFPKSYLKSTIKVKGQKLLNNTLKQRNGIIFVSGHFGAWEILAAWLGYNKYPVTAVAVKQKNRGSDKFFIELRGHFGMKHIYRKSSLDNMYNVLERGDILALVSDQDARKRGVFINYFNRETSTPKGAARFHLENGAPIIFTICYQNKPNDYTIEFHPIKIAPDATIESITQLYTSLLEEYVRRFPEQYFWFHRRWKTKPDTKSNG